MPAVQPTADRPATRPDLRDLFHRSDPRDQRWYFDAHEQLVADAAELGVSLDTFAGIVAALSPRQSWDTANGRTPNRTAARQLVRTRTAPCFGECVRQALEILDGAEPLEALTGEKRRAFYSNLVDPETSSAVTLDSWMARALGHPRDSFTPKQYARFAAVVTAAAESLDIRPHELQAAVWAMAREGRI
jgi:hypothetical protein